VRNRKMLLWAIALTIATVGQIVAAFALHDSEASELRMNIGWGILMLSGLFGWLPIVEFRRKGRVQGRGYIHTSVLVDSGVYGIVRHPQYLAGVLMSIALPMISWHWVIVVLGIAAAAMYYSNTFDEEEGCIEKFGDEYRRYMQRVPRMNFVLGVLRMIVRRTSREE
jgi:protein-S-isoprenylcysteine O-methyltransferase Ste14